MRPELWATALGLAVFLGWRLLRWGQRWQRPQSVLR
jgi:hypothetical protein